MVDYEQYEWGKKRLNFWLRLDYWNVIQATLIISDIDPASTGGGGAEAEVDHGCFTSFRTFQGAEVPKRDQYGDPLCTCGGAYAIEYKCGECVTSEWALERLYKEYTELRLILEGRHKASLPASPYSWIQRAIFKKIDIPWLSWAQRANLVCADVLSQPQTESEPFDITRHPKWRKAFEYDSEGLNALYDLIERYFFDEGGNPIYDPKNWPIKKKIESPSWSQRTIDEADTIITSGKRKGKAAK
ncbi:MAG: hypothetical protein K0S36_410 [Nitrosospira multiformis]|jgi:hypothetical protein|nr:hypothetical protein [Nitrosospira multiformis]